MQTKVYDLKKRTYIYALDVIKFLEGLPKDYIAYIIGKQLLSSATSVGANIIASSILTMKGKKKF